MALPTRSATLSLALAAAMVAGPVVAQAQERTELAKPFAELSRTILAGRDSLVRVTKQQVGLRYRLGTKEPGKAFDCSALVQWIAGLFGKDMPRTAAQQAQVGIDIPKDTTQLLPGDLLYFGKGKRITHIGIYVGEGRYVHAANRRKGVIESELAAAKSTYWKGAKRIFWDADSALGVLPKVVGSPES